MRFFVRKSCGKSHFFLVEKSIVVYKTEGSEKYVYEKRRVDLGGPRMRIERVQKKRGGDWRYRSPYPSNANRMLYPLIINSLDFYKVKP